MLTDIWCVNNAERADARHRVGEFEIKISSPEAPVYLMLGSEGFEFPTQIAPDAVIDGNTRYRLTCSSETKDGDLHQLLYLIEYGGNKRVATSTASIKSTTTNLRFHSHEDADRFRILIRFVGVGTVIIRGMQFVSFGTTSSL